ncbi:MAG: nitroreductase family protein [Syntrophaceae bacterium]|nr:nitroreductase family protein [Syntrophaceae bacterium]
MDRRSFLKFSGKGILLLGGMSMMSACSGVKREDLPRLNGEKTSLKGLEKDEMEILYLASLAPSGHNTQPWTVKIVEPKHWVIGSDKKRWLTTVDPDNRELLLGMGAFIENLVLAAGIFGYEADVQIIAKNASDLDIADIRLRKGKTIEFPLEKIKKRRTVRSGYTDQVIKTEDLKYITKHDSKSCTLPHAPSPHSFYYPNNSPQGKYLQEGTIEANRKQAFRDPAQEELANWIRWSNKEAKQYRNGLTPESMEIKGIAGLFVRNFYNRQSVLKKSFRDQTVDIVAKQVNTCGGWLVVNSSDSNIPTLIEYGKVFENMLLRIRERMIAIHPMTQMLEEEPWKKQIAKELGLAGDVQWILRIGYLKSYPDPVSLRMPVPWFVKT